MGRVIQGEVRRKCLKCGKTRPYTREFFRTYKGKVGGRTCRDCLRHDQREYDATSINQLPENKKERNQKLRLQVLLAYGNRCACCGESRREFLAIDHIHGGGNKHKLEEIGVRTASTWYLWIIDNGFPSILRLLCHNCNQSMGYYGYCPHEKERETRAKKRA